VAMMLTFITVQTVERASRNCSSKYPSFGLFGIRDGTKHTALRQGTDFLTSHGWAVQGVSSSKLQ